MSIGFYELLQVAPDASLEVIRAAYQDQVAQAVRKARAAEARHQDPAAVEARRHALAEAYAVLSDPVRRRRYDRFRELSREPLQLEPEEFWRQASASLVDPAAAAALEVVRTLTDLKVGEPLGSRKTARPEGARPEPSRSETARPESARPEPTRLEAVRSEAARPEMARPEAVRSEIDSDKTRVIPPEAPKTPVRLASIPPVDPSDELKRSELTRPRRLPEATDALRLSPPDMPQISLKPGAKAPPPISTPRAVSAEDIARLVEHLGPTGACLKAIREARGVSLEELSNTTRISQRFLDALERDAYNDLPAATFVRGYVKMVTRILQVTHNTRDLDEYVDGYMARFHRSRG
jgi:hypothetical protein